MAPPNCKKTKKKGTMAELPAFKQEHALKYGLKLVSSTADGDQSVQCMFCVYEGRDKVEITAASTRKRKERNSVHHFKKPFRSQNYVSHHKQHQASWEVYQSLSIEDKMVYFKGKVSNEDTLQKFFDSTTDTIVYTIKASIVENVIGELFFPSDLVE
ncbi:hypothetical protein SPRG_11008 [Saprolegnia parasitica CBS 223.65]|uniref:Uncharacterized protein n=1 Tax=Saprolegnia parasitica (strain CBS 223.65) TaxID=695850 RepID=A0A067BWS3_SAPPC|nr:hypothetical protein SPRG_11008 [Saprolegnia parasitica CBS 223.65]KDO22693.1 hypothetical protein SPRG_11008 [Saprolegnia parasitica CBS 223.65]|eukprot:XP_012206607.1 hypothetical protein SPRG_11008 [Saprolegnia parasitica CBS 223.65]